MFCPPSTHPHSFLISEYKAVALLLFHFADIGTCAITAIPFEKSKVLFGLEELEEFSMVDETDAQATTGDLSRSTASLEKWGWIMFECGIENLTVKGKSVCEEVRKHEFGRKRCWCTWCWCTWCVNVFHFVL